MQSVGTLGQGLALDGHRIRELDGRIFVGAGTPHLAVGHEAAPHFALIDQRAVIVEGDIGNSNSLRYHGMLAGPRQIQKE